MSASASITLVLLQRRYGRTSKLSLVCFIDQVQHPHRPSIMRLRTQEVVAPDMVGALGMQPYARSIVEPQPASWPLLL